MSNWKMFYCSEELQHKVGLPDAVMTVYKVNHNNCQAINLYLKNSLNVLHVRAGLDFESLLVK